jgi:hypothetical protein
MRRAMDEMQMAPRTPEQIAELQRQSMNASMNTGHDGLAARNGWPPRPFEGVRIHPGSDFADTEPAAPPGSEGRLIVLAAVIGVVVLVILGVWHAYF